MSTDVPTALTPGRIAEVLGAPLPRVLYILRTRPHIRPVIRAGRLRVYDSRALAQVRYELNKIDAQRHRTDGSFTDEY